jgi:hypothetical protein
VAEIFISYRREDTSGYAGRLSDALGARYGSEHVFMDVTAITPGADFVNRIEQAVGSCDVLVVLIGDQWLSMAVRGSRRLDDPEDFVRHEVAAGLRSDRVRVIPVLVEGAEMPTMSELPEDLVPLARRNAIELSDSRWSYDVNRLEQAIGPATQARRAASGLRSLPIWAKLAPVALLVAGVGAAVALSGGGSGRGPDVTQDSQAKSRALALVGALRACFSRGQDYEQCRTPGTLPVGVPIGRGRGLAEVNVTSPATFEIVSRSQSGHTFRYEITVEGEPTRTCTPLGKGGCPGDGRW